jgi:hypothetical protein
MCSGKRVKNSANNAVLSPFYGRLSANKGVFDAFPRTKSR